MKNSKLRHLKNKWVITGLVIFIIVASFVYMRGGGKKPVIESVAVAIGDVREIVSVTGTISPADRSNLSFKRGGVVSHVYAKVGDRVKRGQLIATLDMSSEIAALRAAEATLSDMSRSLTSEEYAVERATLTTAEKSADNAIHDAYVRVQSALFNYTDTFFTNPQSVNPTINLRTDTTNIYDDINNKRLIVSDVLTKWSNRMNDNNAKMSDVVNDVLSYLRTIKSFMNDLSVIVSDLNPSNSGQSQTILNTYLSVMNSGLTSVNTAIDAVTDAQSALSSAQSKYNLKLAGNSSQAIAAQIAKVDQARAEVNAGSIISPIDGIVTRADPRVGEYVSPGSSGFAVQDTNFKIEARVPEADIAKIAIGNLASTTLDAYGRSIDFPSRVDLVDPAETVVEGVPTYKVTLHFVAPDIRIRSGMTANLEILTREKKNVLSLPFRAIMEENGRKVVRVLNRDGRTWNVVPVETGLKGSLGTIEVLGGLQEGDRVVTYVK